MPFGGNKWGENKFVSYQEQLEAIESVHGKLERIEDEKSSTSKVRRHLLCACVYWCSVCTGCLVWLYFKMQWTVGMACLCQCVSCV